MKWFTEILVVVATLGVMAGTGCSKDQKHAQTPPLSNGVSNAPVQSPPQAQPQPQPQPQPAAQVQTPAAPPVVAPAADPIIARINGEPITMTEFERPLIEGYGLNVLLNMVQLDLARQTAKKQNITITPADIERERERTLARLAPEAKKEDYAQLTEQILQQQRISRPEWDMVMETNSILRKIAEPALVGKISEEDLVTAFNQLYGETVQVRHIEVTNLQEIAEAQRRLAAGESFNDVAKAMSRNQRTAGLGGELPKFSLQTTGLPDSFKETAFKLKEGEVSDPVHAEGAYHLIKLEHRFAPKAVKFEDVKQSVREDMEDRWIQQAMKELRARLGRQALETLKVEDPILKKQYDDKLSAGRARIKDREEINKALERQRENLSTTTQPVPDLNTDNSPTTTEAASPERPPATQPGTAPGTP